MSGPITIAALAEELDTTRAQVESVAGSYADEHSYADEYADVDQPHVALTAEAADFIRSQRGPREPMAAGWSRAARRRAGGTHPLGTAVDSGPGHTVYEDEAFGGGRVEIWDKS